MGADPCDKGVAQFGVVERDVVLDDPECLGPHELLEQLALLFLYVSEIRKWSALASRAWLNAHGLFRTAVMRVEPSCRRPAPMAGRSSTRTLDRLVRSAVPRQARVDLCMARVGERIGCVSRDAVPAATTKSVAQAHGNAGLDELSENRKAYSETTHARL